MKTIFAFAGFVFATVSASAQIFVTNNVSRTNAINVASELKVGMWEEEAIKFLSKHSLTNSHTIGGIAGWGSFYTLTDGTSLLLDYAPRKVALDGHWGGNGILEKVFIQSNQVNIPIIITNTAGGKVK